MIIQYFIFILNLFMSSVTPALIWDDDMQDIDNEPNWVENIPTTGSIYTTTSSDYCTISGCTVVRGVDSSITRTTDVSLYSDITFQFDYVTHNIDQDEYCIIDYNANGTWIMNAQLNPRSLSTSTTNYIFPTSVDASAQLIIRLRTHGSSGDTCYFDQLYLRGTLITTTTITLSPTTMQPTTSVPTTYNPTTAIPTTNNPTTAIPTTDMPTTNIPTTDMPTTAIPTTLIPTTAMPTTAMPTTNIPTTVIPTTDMPTTDIPTTNVPTTNMATTISPTTTTSKTNEPTTSPIHGGNEVIETTNSSEEKHGNLNETSDTNFWDDKLWLLLVIIACVMVIAVIMIVFAKKRRNKKHKNTQNNMQNNIEMNTDTNGNAPPSQYGCVLNSSPPSVMTLHSPSTTANAIGMTMDTIDLNIVDYNTPKKISHVQMINEFDNEDVDGLYTTNVNSQHETAGKENVTKGINDNDNNGEGVMDGDDDMYTVPRVQTPGDGVNVTKGNNDSDNDDNDDNMYKKSEIGSTTAGN